MPGEFSALAAASISSSGHTDGLGRRLLAFDRETGTMLERLRLRPELAAYEAAIRARVTELAALQDEHFARPRRVDRDATSGELTVVSDFIPGNRLSDLLEAAQESAAIPGLDAAFGFLLEALPALSAFHTMTGSAHGLIEPSRTVVTPAGRVIFLDSVFGAIIERLGLSRTRLWTQFGVAAAPAAGPARLNAISDLGQIALSAVMLVLGRRMRPDEFSERLRLLLAEVVEVGQIRGSSGFARGVQRVLQRMLPLPGRRPYAGAEEALAEIRQLVRREIGIASCRQALIAFARTLDAAVPVCRVDDQQSTTGVSLGYSDDVELAPSFHLTLAARAAHDTLEVLDDGGTPISLELGDTPAEDTDSAEVELSLDEASPAPDEAMPIDLADRPIESAPVAETLTSSASPPAAVEGVEDAPEISPPLLPETEPEFAPEPVASGEPEGQVPGAGTHPSVVSSTASGSRRRKLVRSLRARRDKLRSTTPTSQATTNQPGPAVSPPASPPAPLLVAPAVVATFDVQAEPPRPAAVAPAHPPSPPLPTFPQLGAQASADPPGPIFVRRPADASATPPPSRALAIMTQEVVRSPAPVTISMRLPADYSPRRPVRRPGPPDGLLPSISRGPLIEAERPRTFPWKLAAAAVVLVGVAVGFGRAYLPSPQTAPPEPVPVAVSEVPPPSVSSDSGAMAIETQPPGARVLLDGRFVGQSPLNLAHVRPGRRLLTFVSPSGEVTRTVQVTAGETLTVDVPIFSGWVAIQAPVILDVALNGRSVGSTEADRLMLPPGRHMLTLTSSEYGFQAVQSVEIEAGEVRPLVIQPRGTANLNAIPWGEVWLDGQKLGETPLDNVQVPVGAREFVFRHPDYKERRVTQTIRADKPSAIGVDFTR